MQKSSGIFFRLLPLSVLAFQRYTLGKFFKFAFLLIRSCMLIREDFFFNFVPSEAFINFPYAIKNTILSSGMVLNVFFTRYCELIYNLWSFHFKLIVFINYE